MVRSTSFVPEDNSNKVAKMETSFRDRLIGILQKKAYGKNHLCLPSQFQITEKSNRIPLCNAGS